jgi:hypothetical protein
MAEFRGLTAEMDQASVAIVDDRLREIGETRLTEAQIHTAARVGRQERHGPHGGVDGEIGGGDGQTRRGPDAD